jgi:hypothetical protein
VLCLNANSHLPFCQNNSCWVFIIQCHSFSGLSLSLSLSKKHKIKQAQGLTLGY